MDDLISRQAAIDEIKAVYEWHDTVTVDRLIQHFKALPTVDSVPVIRCGFCRYYNSVGYCALHQTEMSKTDFCSYGKKDGDDAEGTIQKERS